MSAFLLFIRAVPLVRWAEFAAFAGLLAVFTYLGVTIQHLHVQVAQAQTAQARAEKATSDEKAGRAADNAVAQAEAASQAVDSLQKTAQLTDKQKEIESANQLIDSQHRAVVAAGDAVARSLHDAYRAAGAAAAPGRGASGADPGSVAVGTPGAPSGDLRADVFDEWVGRARTLEDSLDREYQRHGNCVAEYGNAQAASRSQLAGTNPLK